MSGPSNSRIAASALGAGAGLALLAYGFRDTTGVAVSSAALVGGGVLVGLGLWLRDRNRPPQGQPAHRSAVDIEVLLCAMAAVAAADRQLDTGEMAMIEDVSAGLLGEMIPRARIERAFRQMKGRNPVEQIARLARKAAPEGVELAVKGAVWAGRADGALTATEERLIGEIAAALGVSGHRLRQCIAEADHVHERLSQAGPA